MFSKILSDFFSGNCFIAYQYFGAHPEQQNKQNGYVFRVYAPHAKNVQLISECTNWQGIPMELTDSRGIYSVFVENAWKGMMYKFRIFQQDGRVFDRADPYAFQSQLRPNTASITSELSFRSFHDEKWIASRTLNYDSPMNIYEMHFGSWRMKKHAENCPEQGWYKYDEIADSLISYLKENNFTHVEFLPLNEYPFDGSWGYLISGYFSVTSRYGSPEQLQSLINQLHQNGIGVIFDFVPVHFITDTYALAKFDGTPIYEYESCDVAYSQWGSCNFNLCRAEVRSFLKSAANFLLTVFHADGLRMDAISNALYWQGDSSRGINYGALQFLKEMNAGLRSMHPTAMLIAEDSSSFLKVTAPPEYDGLGFHYKWDLGWMNDTLNYFSQPPEKRSALHNQLTFSMSYFYSELFILPFSHDETVHNKKTIIDKIYGTYEEKFAQCKTLYTYMFTHPGKKLNFMGNEIAHFREWDESRELDWSLLKYPRHDSFLHFFRKLSSLYNTLPALYSGEYNSDSFLWLDADNNKQNVYVYLRQSGLQKVAVILNTSPNHYSSFRFGVPHAVFAKEILNTEDFAYTGSGLTNTAFLRSHPVPFNGFPHSLQIDLAPYASSLLFLKNLPE